MDTEMTKMTLTANQLRELYTVIFEYNNKIFDNVSGIVVFAAHNDDNYDKDGNWIVGAEETTVNKADKLEAKVIDRAIKSGAWPKDASMWMELLRNNKVGGIANTVHAWYVVARSAEKKIASFEVSRQQLLFLIVAQYDMLYGIKEEFNKECNIRLGVENLVELLKVLEESGFDTGEPKRVYEKINKAKELVGDEKKINRIKALISIQ